MILLNKQNIAQPRFKNNYENLSNNKKMLPKKQISFGAGLTPELRKIILDSNPQHTVGQLLLKYSGNMPTGIATDKWVAQCVLWTTEIFQKLKLPIPRGVHLADFSVDGLEEGIVGICTHTVEPIVGKSWKIREVLYNKNTPWEHIDEIMDYEKKIHHSSTGHFLSPFIHEFAHSLHMDHIEKKFGRFTTLKLTDEMRKGFNPFETRLIGKVEGNYAKTNPPELVAETVTKEIAEGLDKHLNPTNVDFRIDRKIADIFNDAWEGRADLLKIFRDK